MYIETDVRIAHRDIRAGACLLTELIDNSVLHLIGYETRVAELLRIDHRVNREGFTFLDVLAPVNLLDFFIHIIGRSSLEFGDRLKNTYGCVKLEIGTIHHLLVAGKRNHSTAYFHIVGTQLGEFFCQDGLKSHEGLGNKFKFIHFYFDNIFIVSYCF